MDSIHSKHVASTPSFGILSPQQQQEIKAQAHLQFVDKLSFILVTPEVVTLSVGLSYPHTFAGVLSMIASARLCLCDWGEEEDVIRFVFRPIGPCEQVAPTT